MRLTKPARVGNVVFKIGVKESLVIECAQRSYSHNDLPSELICLSCLATQSTAGVISRGNSCFSCEEPINPYCLDNIEV